MCCPHDFLFCNCPVTKLGIKFLIYVAGPAMPWWEKKHKPELLLAEKSHVQSLQARMPDSFSPPCLSSPRNRASVCVCRGRYSPKDKEALWHPDENRWPGRRAWPYRCPVQGYVMLCYRWEVNSYFLLFACGVLTSRSRQCRLFPAPNTVLVAET